MRRFPQLFIPCLLASAAPALSIGGGQGYYPGADANSFDTYFNTGGQGFYSGDGASEGGSCYNPVAFSAVRVEEYSRRAPSRVRFERSLSNVGGGWDGKRGEFVTPYSGTYSVSWTALSSPTSHLRLALLLNGQEQLASWADRDGYEAAAGSLNLNLRQGDRLALELTEGEIYEPAATNRGYSSFSAHRIG